MGNGSGKVSKQSPNYTVIPLSMGNGSGDHKNSIYPKDDVLPEYGDPVPPAKTALTYKPATVGSTFNVSMLTTTIGLDDDDIRESDSSDGPSFDFQKIDNHAREACASDARTFQLLAEYLQEPIKDPVDRDLWTLRAVLIWLSERVSEGISYPWPDETHPFGFLSLVREGKATYADLFTRICRQANLKCVTIYGEVKGVLYRPGDKTLPEASWNAVQVNGNWHLVQPYWTCRSVTGYQHGGVTVIEKDQHIGTDVLHRSDGKFVKQFNDYYFLVRPEAFIYESCPYDSRWQLLPPSSTRTMEEFRRQACLFRSFAQLRLKLISIDSCILKADSGVCTIAIKADKSIANRLYTKYTLFAVDLGVQKNDFFISNRQKFVFNERCDNDRFRFEIRFPVEGIFTIDIEFGFKHAGKIVYSKCCSFRLECDKRKTDCKPLPYDVGDVGWGPGPQATDAGLCRPSEKSGRVYVPPKDVVDPRQRLTQDKEGGKEMLFDVDPNMIDIFTYDATLMSQRSGSDFEGTVQKDGPTDLSEHVKSTVDKRKKQLVVKTTLPNTGEYALSIVAAENAASTKGCKPVCHYLLTTEASEEEEAQQKDALENLKKVLGTGNVPKLTTGVRKCEETGVENSNPILTAGRNELTPILKRAAALKDLRHYMKGENVEKLENAYHRCCDAGVDDQQLLSAANKRIEYLRAKKEARDILTSTVEHWYYRDLEAAINGFRKFCEGPRDEEEIKEAESLRERRRAFDAKLLVQIARPTRHSVESFKKALLTPGLRRDSLIQKLRDNLGSSSDPDFANGLTVLISDAQKLQQDQ